MKLEPGTVCLIVNSHYNDGKIVTLNRFLGEKSFRYPNGEDIPHKAWLLNEVLDKGPGPLNGPNDAYIAPEHHLKPLDNPGDDIVDVHSFRKEDEHV